MVELVAESPFVYRHLVWAKVSSIFVLFVNISMVISDFSLMFSCWDSFEPVWCGVCCGVRFGSVSTIIC